MDTYYLVTSHVLRYLVMLTIVQIVPHMLLPPKRDSQRLSHRGYCRFGDGTFVRRISSSLSLVSGLSISFDAQKDFYLNFSPFVNSKSWQVCQHVYFRP